MTYTNESITKALLSLRPGAEWVQYGDTYDGLKWLEKPVWEGGQKKPTREEVEAEVARLQQEWENTEYKRLRSPEYPSITDQLDALFHAGVFPPEMAEQIQAVKNKYPKTP